jgi:hypothetical protein
MCCSNGKVVLPPFKEVPELLHSLLAGTHQHSKYFLEHMRSFNCNLSFASFKSKDVTVPGGGIQLYQVNGEVHYQVGSFG